MGLCLTSLRHWNGSNMISGFNCPQLQYDLSSKSQGLRHPLPTSMTSWPLNMVEVLIGPSGTRLSYGRWARAQGIFGYCYIISSLVLSESLLSQSEDQLRETKKLCFTMDGFSAKIRLTQYTVYPTTWSPTSLRSPLKVTLLRYLPFLPGLFTNSPELACCIPFKATTVAIATLSCIIPIIVRKIENARNSKSHKKTHLRNYVCKYLYWYLDMRAEYITRRYGISTSIFKSLS